LFLLRHDPASTHEASQPLTEHSDAANGLTRPAPTEPL
jgi:hypothetical protein